MRPICGSYFYRALEVLVCRVKERKLCLQALASGQDFPFGDFFLQMAANRFLMLIAFMLCAIQLANAGPVPWPLTSCDAQQVYPPPASSPPVGPAPMYPSQTNVPNDPPKGVPTQGYPAVPIVLSSLPVGGPPAKDLLQDDCASKQQYFTLPLLVQRTPMDFHRTLPFLMDSVDSPSEDRQSPLDMTGFRCKSRQSPVKVHSNYLEVRNGWTGRNSVSVGRLLDFHRISNGQRQKPS
ncbi:uncharacterized protein LACBIDRAFT_324514 [Laccaria bicolor S238N-H82]|uniref:Predicted protein n=1 Tax=Laccaria bicolor (strain S238N-H82 / ATCC MYA-4686) TaxID=486041 RepID=B0D249_LACBS|nr:uncharacterized protein LACBIDRAFT_324514 [Laccaria bicolor S238N-H82]EDR11039.1 predicted protein [Laccaria bicolor S238N-H82]|eukprot:XP_001878340.1 predicted protein [Laccaria bicolor S238N-H82]